MTTMRLQILPVRWHRGNGAGSAGARRCPKTCQEQESWTDYIWIQRPLVEVLAYDSAADQEQAELGGEKEWCHDLGKAIA